MNLPSSHRRRARASCVFIAAIALLAIVTIQGRNAIAQTSPVPAPAAQAATPANAAWLNDLAAWRAQREKEIDAPDGWLTLVALEWLKPGANSVGTANDNQIHLHVHAPDHLGVFEVTGNDVQIQPPAGGFPAELLIDGKPARAGPLVVEGANPSAITWHGVTLVVLSRGDRFALRVKDAASPTRAGFHGLNWYPPDPHFRIEARWIPFPSPQVERIPTVIGTTLNLPSPGVAEFNLDGKTIRLQPVLEDASGKTLFFILRDQTRYTTTYQAARFLNTGLPDHGLNQPGSLTLDFNRLENPPCAYTPYATCPLPPDNNRLLVQLQAGEKRYAP
jgi:hypothetical protein